MKDKYEELKQEISSMIEKIDDAEIIKRSVVISSKIDELKADNDDLAKSKGALLQDYKNLVKTAAYKPAGNENTSGADITQPKTFEEALNAFAQSQTKK